MKNGRLHHDEGSGDVVLELDLDGVRLIDGDGREGEKIRRPDEEVSVESLHSKTWKEGRGQLLEERLPSSRDLAKSLDERE